MALYRVNTENGNIIIDAPSEQAAKSRAFGWQNFEFRDMLEPGESFNFQSMTAKAITPGSVTYGDRLWNGFNEFAGEVNHSNFVDIQNALIAGKPWDWKDPEGVEGKKDVFNPETETETDAERRAREAEEARIAQEAKRISGDPMIDEAVGGRYGGAGVGFDRALGEFGYGSGVLRSIMNAKRAPLEALASLGYAGRSGADLFQNLGEGREYQDIFGKAFRGMAGDRDPGLVGGKVFAPFSLSGSARDLFDVDPTGGELASMYSPVLGAAAGTSGMPKGVSGDAAARLVAELGLAGYGRGRFGAMSAFLPTADQLVSDFASQPIGTGQSDIREYIRNRLTR